MREPILITGGAGFIGSHLAEALAGQGAIVRVLDSLDPQVHGPGATRARLLPPGVEFLHGPVRDAPLVDRALEGVRTVVHLAAAVGVGQSMYAIASYVEANVGGTAVLLDRIVNRRPRIDRLVVASSMSIYGEGRYRCSGCGPVAPPPRPLRQLQAREWEMRCPQCGLRVESSPTDEDKPLNPTSVYAVTKRDQEELCLCVGRAYGIPTVALRLFNVYGPRQALSNPYTGVAAIFGARLLNRQSPLVFEDGLQTRDLVHVSDVVAAFQAVLATPSVADVAINIGTGQATSIRDIAVLLAKSLKIDRAPEIVGRFREGDIRHCVANIERAKRLLGFTPRVGFGSGLADLVQWMLTQRGEDHVPRATAELEERGLIR